ncbi:MAG: NrpR regulatory domain-containing protein [Euryarchaeota archaeon]
MTSIETQRKIIEILRILDASDDAIGARTIAAILSERGYPIGERAVRHYLVLLDYKGFTLKIGNAGRVITEKGLNELNEAIVGDRVGFLITRIEDLVYKTSFDLKKRDGNVIINVATIDKDDFDRALETAAETINNGYTVSPFVRIVEEGEKVGAVFVPYGSFGFVTMCSMTINGMLIKHGIPSTVKYGGLLKIEDRIPSAYTDLILYQGTSLDPIQVFAARQMTSILAAVQRGDGTVLANMQTVPSIAAERTLKLLQDAKRTGIVGWIESPLETNFLGVNNEDDVMEINIFAGANPMASLHELDIKVKVYSLSSLMDAKLLNQRL